MTRTSRRRFRASNYQSTTRVKPFICTMPMRLDEGWNQIQFNLSDFTRRAYGTNYIETLRVQIHANCRIRRIYFSDRLYSEEELPPEFKLFLPIQKDAAGAAPPRRALIVAHVMQRARSSLREGRRPPRAWSQPPPCARCAPRRPKSRRPVFSPDRASAHRAAPARRGARVSNDGFAVLALLDVVASMASRRGRRAPGLRAHIAGQH